MTHIINPKITPKQRCIIIGTILGGSSIVRPQKGKNCYLSMRNKDLDWLKYKSNELSNLATKDPITSEKTYRWHSICYPLFNEFHEMFYEEKERRIKVEILNLLQDTSIAVWYKDCAAMNKEYIIFNTHIWGETGSNIICDYFNSLDWKSSVFIERKNYRVKLDKDSSNEIIKMYKSLEFN